MRQYLDKTDMHLGEVVSDGNTMVLLILTMVMNGYHIGTSTWPGYMPWCKHGKMVIVSLDTTLLY